MANCNLKAEKSV